MVGQAVDRPPLDFAAFRPINVYNPWYFTGHYGLGYGYGYNLGYSYGCGGWCSPWGWNPYWGYSSWAPYGYGGYGPGGYGAYGYGAYDPYGSSSSSNNMYAGPEPTPARQIGSLRLKTKPASAKVYIDGVLVGIVDDFDGLTDHLELDAGPHQMEIRAEGYLPFMSDITVPNGRTMTQRVSLKKK